MERIGGELYLCILQSREIRGVSEMLVFTRGLEKTAFSYIGSIKS